MTATCRSFRPGHNVHLIQASRRARDGDILIDARDATITGETLVLQQSGAPLQLFHHDMDALGTRLVDAHVLRYNEAACVLEVWSGSTRFLFSVSRRWPGECR